MRPLPSVFVPFLKPTDTAWGPSIASAPSLTAEQCATLGLPVSGGGETRAKVQTVGPWHICRGVTAIACVKEEGGVRFYPARKGQVRSMETDPAFRCSIGGRKVRAFLSSQLFTLPDGTLHNAAVLFVK